MTNPENVMVIITKNGGLVGKCVKEADGWFFHPAVQRGKSRKPWPSANKCIPKWAFDMSDEMLTWEEWKQIQEAA